jgi:hypothetical protein
MVMVYTTAELRRMRKRVAGIHAEIAARFAQDRRDSESVEHLANLRRIEAAMFLAIAGR